MSGRGRPSKFSEEVKRQILTMAKFGLTDVQMAEVLGVTDRTLNNWKQDDAIFFQSLKEAKDEADKNVERSLYERACGYDHPEDKIFNNNGSPLIVPTIKHYPPDTTAAIFWLKNRQSERWRDKIEHDGKIDTVLRVIYESENRNDAEGV